MTVEILRATPTLKAENDVYMIDYKYGFEVECGIGISPHDYTFEQALEVAQSFLRQKGYKYTKNNFESLTDDFRAFKKLELSADYMTDTYRFSYRCNRI